MIRLTVDYNQLRLTVCPFHWTPRAAFSPPLPPLDRVDSCNTKHYDDHYDGDEYQPKHDNLKVDNVMIMSMNNKQCCSPETPKRLCQTLGRQPSRSERASTTTNLLSATDSSRLKPDNASFSCLPQVHSIFMMTTTSTTVAKMTTTMMVFGRCMQCKQSGCELARTGFSPTPVDW